MSLKEPIVYQNGTMYAIRYEGGGQVPAHLEGMYTSVAEAKAALAAFKADPSKSYSKNRKKKAAMEKVTERMDEYKEVKAKRYQDVWVKIRETLSGKSTS